MQQTSRLTARQYDRDDINLPVELIVAKELRAQVTFSASSAATDSHIVLGVAHDVSPGGVGIETKHYLPRMCEALLRLYDGPKDDPSMKMLIEHRVKVRRVYMTSREPMYSLGVAFVAPDAELSKRVNDVLSMFGERRDGTTDE